MRGLARLYELAPGLHRVLAIEGLRAGAAAQIEAFDVRVIAMQPDHEVLIGRHRVHAHGMQLAFFRDFRVGR